MYIKYLEAEAKLSDKMRKINIDDCVVLIDHCSPALSIFNVKIESIYQSIKNFEFTKERIHKRVCILMLDNYYNLGELINETKTLKETLYTNFNLILILNQSVLNQSTHIIFYNITMK